MPRIIGLTLAAVLVGFFAGRGVEFSLDFFVLVGGVAIMYGLIAAGELLPHQAKGSAPSAGRLPEPRR